MNSGSNTHPEPRQTTDTLTFAKSSDYFLNELDKLYPDFESQYLHRVKEIQDAIGNTTEVHTLTRLDATAKFYHHTGQVVTLLKQGLEYMASGMKGIDPQYWQAIMEGQKIKEENQFLKETITSLEKREELLIYLIRKAKNKINAV